MMDPFDLRQWPGFGLAGGKLSEPAIIDQIVIDSRRIYSRHTLFVALKGEKEDGHSYLQQAAQAGAKYALVSHQWHPSSSLDGLQLLRVASPLKAFQEIAKSYRLHLPVKIIGITGSFGKTMLKDLLFELLAKEKKTAASPESFNSQIGVPLSLFTLRKEHEIALIEAAISHPHEMDILTDLIRPDFTILTPIGKKHLSTLNDLSTLAQEMMRLMIATSPSGWSLLLQDPLIQPYENQIPCPTYFWNTPSAHLPHAKLINPIYTIPAPYSISFPDGLEFKGTISSGMSYFLNLINMAVKAAWLSGISSQSIHDILSHYQVEPMRTEIWKSPLGSTFINDMYSSDPQSVDLALHHFNYAAPHHRKIFVFGGMRQASSHAEIDYKRVGKVLAKTKLDQLILFGSKPFESLMKEIKHSPHPPTITVCADYQEAIQVLKSTIRGEDTILIKGEKKVPLDSIIETFNDSLNNNQCTINLAAIQSNIRTLRKKLPHHTRMMVIVKALAYGTDDVRIAKFLAKCGIDILGVSYVDEAVALRRAGVEQALFSINAAMYETAKVVKWDLEVSVSDKHFIQALSEEAEKQKKVVKVHLHVNTGMNRFGCRPEEALQLALLIKQSPYLILEGILTHFACAEDPSEDSFTKNQAVCFDQVIQELQQHGIDPQWKHAANSSATIRFSFANYNMVRLGLAIYGLYVSDATREALDLRLALSLTSRIVGINVCKKGETVSYGRHYQIQRDSQRIAVLPIGYFDGLHRHYSGKAYVLIRGQKAPMVGNICMDYMMVDITDIPDAQVGDQVLFFGEDEFGQYLSPEDLATSGNSIVHELITCLGPRIQRIFLYEEGHQVR